jgi:nucleotidyltransferase substrate binding protein (TIGR01987 family)
MEEQLKERYATLILSQEAFERSLNLYRTKFSQAEKAEREAYVASVIKHFELLYEMIWKFFKQFLQIKYGIQAVGSKTIFRACYEKNLIDETTLKSLLEIVEIRNTTTHVYDESMAVKIGDTIMNHYEPMKKLIRMVTNI